MKRYIITLLFFIPLTAGIVFSQEKPKLFIVLHGKILGQNVLAWSPTIAAALKSGQYSQIHVIGDLAGVIPPRAGLVVHQTSGLDYWR